MIGFVGIVCLDIVIYVPRYPEEDAEVRGTSAERRRGGNASNSSCVAADLGIPSAFFGSGLAPSVNDDAKFLHDDMDSFGVCRDGMRLYEEGTMPTSWIPVSESTGSRTIIHVRDLPEYSSRDLFRGILKGWGGDVEDVEGVIDDVEVAIDAGLRVARSGAGLLDGTIRRLAVSTAQDAVKDSVLELFRGALKGFSWFHLELRGSVVTRRMLLGLLALRTADMKISLEVEKARPDSQDMWGLADVVVVSREFVQSEYPERCREPEAAVSFLKRFVAAHATLVLPWGTHGVFAIDKKSSTDHILHVPAFTPPGTSVLDTVGAGDSFQAALFSALSKQTPLPEALAIATKVAGFKVTRRGFRDLSASSGVKFH